MQSISDFSVISVLNRLVGVVRLDREAMRAVSRDKAMSPYSWAIVFIMALLGGLGFSVQQGTLGLVGAMVARLGAWIIFVTVTSLVCSFMVPEATFEPDSDEIRRPIGFAQAPNFLGFFEILGGILGSFIAFIGSIWTLACVVVAVSVVLSASTARAIAITLISGIITGLILLFLLLIFSPFFSG